MTYRWTLFALGCASLIACGHPSQPKTLSPSPAPAFPPSASAPAINKAPIKEQEQAQNEIETMLAKVSELRSLNELRPVLGRTIDRPTMRKQVEAKVRAEIPAQAIEGEGDFLKAFGLVPKDFDYESGIYSLIESQLAGYYDPADKVMFLMSDLGVQEAEITLAHELVHALQDQHYDLDPRLKYRPDKNDEQSAVQCLAEGDATSAMLDYIYSPRGMVATDVPDDELRLELLAGMAVSPELAKFPRVLRTSLVAPYVDGTLFVHALRRRGGWASVNSTWERVPQTTEQVLHLDKLDAHEPAEPVSVPTTTALGPGWTLTYSEVFGEQSLRIVLEEWMPKRVAESVAKGWGGDHGMVAVQQVEGVRRLAAAWHIRFDQLPAGPADALEALKTISDYWDAPKGTPTQCKSLPGGGTLAVVLHGRDIALVAVQGAASSAGAPECAQATKWAAAVAAEP